MLAVFLSLAGDSPPASAALPASVFPRWQVLWSFSGAKIAQGKADEAVGLSPSNEDHAALGDLGPEKPYCPLFINGMTEK